MPKRIWALAIHGEAGPALKSDYTHDAEDMKTILKRGSDALRDGETAIEVVTSVVKALEESGFHMAGKGAAPNSDNKWELDAAIMDGTSRKAGAVGAIRDFRSPVECARTVMEQSPYVFLVGKGAMKFLKSFDLEKIRNPKSYYKPALSEKANAASMQGGSVGAVALDAAGRLASATSSGGMEKKQAGRVSESPLIGAGTWADERIAVSCAGQGEYFIRSAAAADLSARIRYAQTDLKTAAACVMEDVSLLGGRGGLIALDRLGRVAMPYNTSTMKRGFASYRGEFEVKVY